MWKASVGIPAKPKIVEDDDWETDPDFVNNVTEQEQRWGSKTIEGSGRTAGAIDMAKLREETTKANENAKEKQKAEQPNASYGYGGKFGVERDRMDSSAVGHDYVAKVVKHVSQTDYSTGFGGKFGVQTDRVDKSAMSWNHKEKIEKHASQKDYSSGFGGKFGVEHDRQDKSAVGWDYLEKVPKHDSQTVSKTGVEKSQKPSELKAKFENLAQKKDEPPRPLGKPKSVAQRWPPVSSNTDDGSSVKKSQPVMKTFPVITPAPAPAKEVSSAPHPTYTPSPVPISAPVPVPTATPTPLIETSTEPPLALASPQPAIPTATAVSAVQQSVLLGNEFQSNRQSSEEEWDTGRDDETPPVSIAPNVFSVQEEKEKVPEDKRQDIVVNPTPSLVDEDLAERVMREEMALREQLAQEIDADAYDQDAESTFTAIALYDYQAAADDEISFDPDEIITNIEMIDDGWWRGTCRGATGLFPANYVQLQE